METNSEVGTRSAELRRPVFQIGEKVWSAISHDEHGMVTGIILRPGYIRYAVTWANGLRETDNFDIELSREPLFSTPTR